MLSLANVVTIIKATSESTTSQHSMNGRVKLMCEKKHDSTRGPKSSIAKTKEQKEYSLPKHKYWNNLIS